MATHECTYNPSQYERDDMGYWLTCTQCGHHRLFEVNSLRELDEVFGLDTDNDYTNEEEDEQPF